MINWNRNCHDVCVFRLMMSWMHAGQVLSLPITMRPTNRGRCCTLLRMPCTTSPRDVHTNANLLDALLHPFSGYQLFWLTVVLPNNKPTVMPSYASYMSTMYTTCPYHDAQKTQAWRDKTCATHTSHWLNMYDSYKVLPCKSQDVATL